VLDVSGDADFIELIPPKSQMSTERVDDVENDSRHLLSVISLSADRRCGSVSPTNLPCTKQEGIKSSATEPHLSSAHSERDRNVRYVMLGFISPYSFYAYIEHLHGTG